MLIERFKLKVTDVDGELQELDARNKASKRALSSQLRMLRDRAAKEGLLVSMGDLPQGMTIQATEASLQSLKGLYLKRKRHLTALKRVLQDEVAEIADSQQERLPLDKEGGNETAH